MANIAFLYKKVLTASTVYDHIEAFEKFSAHNVSFLDIGDSACSADDLSGYDVIVIHYTISVMHETYFPTDYRLKIRESNTIKIAFIQDEYRRVNDVIEHFSYLKINILFTCVPESEWEKVYPTEKLPSLVKIQTLTGFVPDRLLTPATRTPFSERSVDVIYRARRLSAWYGRLGKEKWQIGDLFSENAKKTSLVCDISSREQDRIYGDNWVSFLSNAKSALGCESGASVFDFTGHIQEQVEDYESTHPNASFEEIEQRFFPGLDGQIYLNQISPRCFECAALGTLMVLYDGEYSGILKPWKHYVPLRKDHSNFEEVLHTISDQQHWEKITECAYREIACNEAYSYKAFIEKFDAALNRFLSTGNHSTLNTISTVKLGALGVGGIDVQLSLPSRIKRKIIDFLVDLPPPIRRPILEAIKMPLHYARDLGIGYKLLRESGNTLSTPKLLFKKQREQILLFANLTKHLDLLESVYRKPYTALKMKGVNGNIHLCVGRGHSAPDSPPGHQSTLFNNRVYLSIKNDLDFPESLRNTLIEFPSFPALINMFSDSTFNFFSRREI